MRNKKHLFVMLSAAAILALGSTTAFAEENSAPSGMAATTSTAEVSNALETEFYSINADLNNWDNWIEIPAEVFKDVTTDTVVTINCDAYTAEKDNWWQVMFFRMDLNGASAIDDLQIEDDEMYFNGGGYSLDQGTSKISFRFSDKETVVNGDTVCSSLEAVKQNGLGICGYHVMLRDMTFETRPATDTISVNGKYLKFTELDDNTLEVTGSETSALKEIEIPAVFNGKMVTSIGEYAFKKRRQLTKVTIPDSVTSIGGGAFNECRNLTSVNIPEGVKSIGHHAFRNCAKLSSIDLPDSLECIGSFAFLNCNLSSVEIPKNVTDIGNGAFGACPLLTEIVVNDNNTAFRAENGVLFNIDKTVLVHYPTGNKAKSYIIPDGVTNIAAAAFETSSNLTSVTIPDSVEKIGDFAFECCSGLTSVKIPNGVKVIPWGTFNYCPSMKSVTIPASVETIEDIAFDGCTNIMDIYYGGSEENWNNIGIAGGNDPLLNATIHYNSINSAAPSAVTGFNGTATSNSVKLTWTKNAGADSYKIKQLVDGKWKELTKTSSNATTSYTVSGLKPNTEYQFAIYTFKGTQFSAAKKVTVKTTAAKPAAVTGFKGTPTSNSVKLTWTKNASADSYKIKQLVNGKWKELTKTANNATTSYTVSGLKPNTEYQFAIYAFKGTQFSAATKVTVKTTAAKPTAVTGFKGMATSNSVKLTWTKNAGADSYKIKQLVNGKWKELTKTANNATTSYTVSGLKPNTEYQFAIYAFKGTQFSAATKVTVKTTAAKPTAVTGFKGTATSNSVKLTWTKNAGADSYKIKQLVNGKWKELTKTANNATTSYTVSGLKPNTEYQFAIYAFKGTQFSATAKVTVKTKPSAVTGFSGTVSRNTVKLSWNKNATADSYKIKQLVNGTWKELTKTSDNSTVTYTVTGLAANTEYKFSIYAFNGTQFSKSATLILKTAN